MVRYTSGYICVAVTEADADRLDLPPMFRVNQDRRGTAYTVTVDAREGVTTGISASDRKSTRLNSSHANISYAVFCLKKKRSIARSWLTTVNRHIPCPNSNRT